MVQKLNAVKQNPNFPVTSGKPRLRENPPAHNDIVSSYFGTEGRCPSSLPRMDGRHPHTHTTNSPYQVSL